MRKILFILSAILLTSCNNQTKPTEWVENQRNINQYVVETRKEDINNYNIVSYIPVDDNSFIEFNGLINYKGYWTSFKNIETGKEYDYITGANCYHSMKVDYLNIEDYFKNFFTRTNTNNIYGEFNGSYNISYTIKKINREKITDDYKCDYSYSYVSNFVDYQATYDYSGNQYTWYSVNVFKVDKMFENDLIVNLADKLHYNL